MITSVQNQQVKKWRKLHNRKDRNKFGLFFVEGDHLVEEAIKSGWDVKEIIINDKKRVPDLARDISITVVSEEVFQHLSQTKAPQGIAAIIAKRNIPLQLDSHILLVDAIQDPGNLGTIIRTADAAGFSGVVLGEGTVDVYNDKTIRATQGSIFHISIVEAPLPKEIHNLKYNGYTIWASALKNAVPYQEVEKRRKLALIVGNEGSGIHEHTLSLADSIVKIPIYGKAESLNVSVAAGILMYHMAH